MTHEQEIFAHISDERQRQKDIWGENGSNHRLIVWTGILTEELGEATKAALEEHFEDENDETTEQFRVELIQIAAVCVAALEEIYEKNHKND